MSDSVPLTTGEIDPAWYPPEPEQFEGEWTDGLPSIHTFADLMYTPTASERKTPDGGQCPVIEFYCLRCKRRLLATPAQAIGPPGKPVPLCYHCLKDGFNCVLQQRGFSSGPLAINV